MAEGEKLRDFAPTGKDLPFTEALDYWQQKARVPTKHYSDLWDAMHARAFVVAGATNDALLAGFQKAIDDAIAKGTTLGTFRKEFDRLVAAHGWDHTGKPGWRSAVIYETNIRSAYNAGRWVQAERSKATRPYGRYVAVQDKRTRDAHRAISGTVLRLDDPWWDYYMPPNGYRCRCRFQSLSDRDLKRYSYKVSPSPQIIMKRGAVNTPDGPVMVETPEGITPGFASNAGRAWGAGQHRHLLQTEGEKFRELVAPSEQARRDQKLKISDLDPVPAPALGKPVSNIDEAKAEFRKLFGGEDFIMKDPTGEAVALTTALIDHWQTKTVEDLSGRTQILPWLVDLIENPQEIWLGFAESDKSGQVRLRRRYIKHYHDTKGRSIRLVADEAGGYWIALTTFRGKVREMKNWRGIKSGVLVYSADQSG